MMEKVFKLDNLPEAAAAFIEHMGSRKVFAFYGSMGAGKTTFISEVCRLLGADDDSGSPTFSIVNEYRDGEGEPLYHFDFYRIDNPEEALDMGVEEYFYSGFPCFVEWPERIGSLMPDDAVEVVLTVNPDGSRHLKMDD